MIFGLSGDAPELKVRPAVGKYDAKPVHLCAGLGNAAVYRDIFLLYGHAA
jgi:hypothetical protein